MFFFRSVMSKRRKEEESNESFLWTHDREIIWRRIPHQTKNRQHRFQMMHRTEDVDWIQYNYEQLQASIPLAPPPYEKIQNQRLRRLHGRTGLSFNAITQQCFMEKSTSTRPRLEDRTELFTAQQALLIGSILADSSLSRPNRVTSSYR